MSELPPLPVQQELILQNIPAGVRSLARQLTPTDKLLFYQSWNPPGFVSGDGDKIEALIQSSGPEMYRYLLGIATTATNPNQLYNALSGLTGIKRWANNHPRFDLQKTTEDFLHTLTSPPPHDF